MNGEPGSWAWYSINIISSVDDKPPKSYEFLLTAFVREKLRSLPSVTEAVGSRGELHPTFVGLQNLCSLYSLIP